MAEGRKPYEAQVKDEVWKIRRGSPGPGSLQVSEGRLLVGTSLTHSRSRLKGRSGEMLVLEKMRWEEEARQSTWWLAASGKAAGSYSKCNGMHLGSCSLPDVLTVSALGFSGPLGSLLTVALHTMLSCLHSLSLYYSYDLGNKAPPPFSP